MSTAGDLVSRKPLFSDNGDGTNEFNVPLFDYEPLHNNEDEIRLLRLYQALGEDVNDMDDHVCCDFETMPLSAAPPFIAIKNARGYRIFESAIEVNGEGLVISTSLDRFLRNFRARITEPIWIWVRHICVIQWDPVEKERYWTRDWSDRMYATATEVFDMHAFNSKLLEDGTIERVIDGRFRNWTKEWHSTVNGAEVVMPQVYPIWLGTKPANKNPTDAYKYVPLDPVADEIRVMVLTPSEDPMEPIVMHAGHCPIKCDVTYVALSYQWGTDPTQSPIVLNGQKKYIRSALERTLRSIRRTDKGMPIWIDAISINQEDLEERNRQVSRMGTIYDNAVQVVSYVGDYTEDSDLALEMINELQEPMMRINDRGEWHFGEKSYKGPDQGWIYGENKIPPEKLWAMLAALYKFLTRPYFRRAWVLQELAWASNPVVFMGSGKGGLGLRRFDQAIYNFLSMLQFDPTLASLIETADPSIGRLDINELAFPRKLFYFRHLISNANSQDGLIPLQYVQIPNNSPGFLEVLVMARDFEATNPRDKIYALWNLARDKTGLDFETEYDKPYEEVCREFARAWIEQQRSLDILGCAEATIASQEFYETTPSWVPNWNAKAEATCLVRKEAIPTTMMFTIPALDGELYSADGGLHRDEFERPLFRFEGDTLCCTGLILDQIGFILPEPPEMPSGYLVPACDPESFYKFHCWIAEIEKLELETYDDPMRAATAMFHGDVPSTWLPREENLDNRDERYPEEKYVAVPALARHFDGYANSYKREDAWNAVKTVIRGRRPFISRDGYMGLMPSYLMGEEGLMLAIVATCSVPLILREKEDGSYQLCGTAFVQGWMEREVLTSMLGAESPKEAWGALVGKGQVRIR